MKILSCIFIWSFLILFTFQIFGDSIVSAQVTTNSSVEGPDFPYVPGSNPLMDWQADYIEDRIKQTWESLKRLNDPHGYAPPKPYELPSCDDECCPTKMDLGSVRELERRKVNAYRKEIGFGFDLIMSSVGRGAKFVKGAPKNASGPISSYLKKQGKKEARGVVGKIIKEIASEVNGPGKIRNMELEFIPVQCYDIKYERFAAPDCECGDPQDGRYVNWKYNVCYILDEQGNETDRFFLGDNHDSTATMSWGGLGARQPWEEEPRWDPAPSCTPGVCGDGILDEKNDKGSTEECDDGNTVSGDGCDENCYEEVCGDSIVNNNPPGVINEECESYYPCFQKYTTVDAVCGSETCMCEYCGDGIVNQNEECDDANDVEEDGCNNVCRLTYCGDGEVQEGEDCDDENDINTDYCPNSCVFTCGDGHLATKEQGHLRDEECDDGNVVEGDGCDAFCWKEEICGNGIDDDKNGDTDCEDSACSGHSTCGSAYCGDGVIDRPNNDGKDEDCDGMNAACEEIHESSNWVCNATCDCVEINECGDGYLATNEECDDGNLQDGDGCSVQCKKEEICDNGIDDNEDFYADCDDSACSEHPKCRSSFCGDDVIDRPNSDGIYEECDGMDGACEEIYGSSNWGCNTTCGCEEKTESLTQSECSKKCNGFYDKESYSYPPPNDCLCIPIPPTCLDEDGLSCAGSGCMAGSDCNDIATAKTPREFISELLEPTKTINTKALRAKSLDTDVGDTVNITNTSLEPYQEQICLNDPNKETEGMCGCGIADSDENNNQIADCLELFVLKTEWEELSKIEHLLEPYLNSIAVGQKQSLAGAIENIRKDISTSIEELGKTVEFPSWAPGGLVEKYRIAQWMREEFNTIKQNRLVVPPQHSQELDEIITELNGLIVKYENSNELVQKTPQEKPENQKDDSPGVISNLFSAIVKFLGLGEEEIELKENTFTGIEEIILDITGSETVEVIEPIQDNTNEIVESIVIDIEEYQCPTFILNPKYKLCNQTSTGKEVPLVFVSECKDSPIDRCYYQCANGEREIDCGICLDDEALNYGEDSSCIYKKDFTTLDTIPPHFITRDILGIRIEGLRLKRSLPFDLPQISNGLADEKGQRNLTAGEIEFQLYVSDESKDEEENNITGEIDWLASKINIERFVDNEPAEFSCLGETRSEIPVSLQALKTSDLIVEDQGVIEFNGSFSECLTMAGEYKLTIKLIDTGGNDTTKVFENSILPGEIHPESSEISVDCDTDGFTEGVQYPLANNSDSCRIELMPYDQYGNLVPVNQTTINFRSDSANSFNNNNSVDANTGISFVEGLQAEKLSEIAFALKALAPSVTKYREHLSCLNNQSIDARIEIPQTDSAGNPTGEASFVEQEIRLRFDPIYTVSPIIDQQVILPGAFDISLNHQVNTQVNEFTPESRLFSSVSASNSDFVDEDINEPGASVQLYQPSIQTRLEEVPSGNYPLHFITKTEYQIEGKTVAYPSGYLGPDPETISTLEIGNTVCEDLVGNVESIPLSLIGAEIEGNIVGESVNTLALDDLGSENLLVQNPLSEDMGGNKIRSEIRTSLWDYLREDGELCPDGVISLADTTDFQGLWGYDQDVVVFEDCEVQIGGESSLGLLPKIRPASGQKTLIIRNGNLKIDANLIYNQIEDSLGIVLINDDIVSYPLIGNIVVHPKVREFVGTYYADGALFGYDGSTLRESPEENELDISWIVNTETKSDLNNNQLLLTGNLISNNTLGGYMIEANKLYDNAYYFSAWEKDIPQSKAIKYDLHYVRRFDEANDKDFCRRESNGDCDKNRMAFVIRNDRRALNFPPPGF